ncbi:hypothetical protein [Actinoalloteichus spitiensis]|uniref:hypothetical protein n=1 Tax=Actinoalloteichus spitiensis TaxID=252394 RepID=UPI0012F6665C|nr:hypothetical protein [Actinoalloteichus spitiensis]
MLIDLKSGCPNCHGTGMDPLDATRLCPTCRGLSEEVEGRLSLFPPPAPLPPVAGRARNHRHSPWRRWT